MGMWHLAFMPVLRKVELACLTLREDIVQVQNKEKQISILLGRGCKRTLNIAMLWKKRLWGRELGVSFLRCCVIDEIAREKNQYQAMR